MKTLNIKKLSQDATIPTYGSEKAACFDIYSSKDTNWKVSKLNNEIGDPGNLPDNIIHAGRATYFIETTVHTGLAVQTPENYRLDIYPRSGWGFKHNIQLGNGTGKIDEDYRGEVMIKLIGFISNLSDLPSIKKGTRIAQGELNPVHRTIFSVQEDLTETKRGSNGLGSTGY